MTGGAALELLLAGSLLASLSGLLVAAACARRRGQRLDSIVRPLHELRGALTVLQLGLPARSAGAETIVSQLERARLALDDLDGCLDGKAAESKLGGAELVDLEALITRGARTWSQLASSAGARVRVRWRAGGTLVMGSAGRLGQVVDNLIANAVEHGGGRVLVESEMVGGKVRVAVIDAGLGVPLVAQRSEAAVRSPRGHGLAISRDVITAHGGNLLFERREQGGAVVIELPVVRPDAVRTSRHETKSVPVPASNGTPRAA
jgi:signal transduction histidine kinase